MDIKTEKKEKTTVEKTTVEKNKIKHLVLSGGGPAGFITYGALRYLAQQEFWHLQNIESIYGCSVGAFFGVIVSLGYEWEWLDDYFIKRPWEKLIHISALTFFEKKGLLDETFIAESIASLLSAKDLKVDITLAELYAHTKIELHMYATNINAKLIEKVDISYKTHPALTVIKALTMTMCYPFLFKPVCISLDECYIDGGLVNNYPLNDCITQTKCNTDEILAFKNIWITNDTNINEESSMFDFMNVIIRKMQREIDTESKQMDVKYTVRCIIENMTDFSDWIIAMNTEESRTSMIEKGLNHAKLFLSYMDTS